MEAGELCFDNGCGDVLVAAWDARGLVGLALDHELESPALTFAEHGSQGFFAEIPGVLRDLIHQASQWAGGEFTTAFWAVGEGDIQGPWRAAVELVLPSSDFSLDAAGLDIWAAQNSLDLAHVALALRLADGPWGVTLGPEDTDQIMATPAEAKRPPESREAVQRAAEMLGEVGMTWVPPVDRVAANQDAHVAERRERAVVELGELDAALFERVREGDVAAVQKLLAAGANVNAKTIDDQFERTPTGDTPLLQAIKQGHEDVVEGLLVAGADIESANCYEQSPLYWSVRQRLRETVDKLRARGADLARPDSNGWTPLHWAAAEGFDEIVQLLLEAGVPKEPANRNGHRPIDLARLRDQTSVLALLDSR